jgi:hypothetical protein
MQGVPWSLCRACARDVLACVTIDARGGVCAAVNACRGCHGACARVVLACATIDARRGCRGASAGPYVPVSQLLQVMAALRGLYVSVLQAMHDAADVEAVLGLYVPALQLLYAWYGVAHASLRAAVYADAGARGTGHLPIEARALALFLQVDFSCSSDKLSLSLTRQPGPGTLVPFR